VSAFYSASALL